ncbi:hypothetical protein P4637_03320 [Halalkalibacterium halodurans]|nr:hypothetical protein [Halalkalibacterium halodurans]MED4105529.1 hypothetical protein [Halalkalibacterium halodurans]MED4109265.1 hypothetical protein [Halalkalibacterium halodurans]MED4149721.1 hypothetical protein [Halalkalibacterium halodurans]
MRWVAHQETHSVDGEELLIVEVYDEETDEKAVREERKGQRYARYWI